MLLRRAIASVLGQTAEDWVHVLVNDGGDPAPIDSLVAEHADRYAGRAIVVHHERCLGMEAASNAGILACDSRFIAIHDDDDSWHPAFLERLLARLGEAGAPTVQGAVCHSEIVTEVIDGDRIVEIGRRPFNPELATISLARLASGNLFPPISFLFSRRAYERAGPFDESLPVLGDWDFNLRFARGFDIEVLPEILACWHHRESAVGSELDNSFQGRDRPHDRIRSLIVNREIRRAMGDPDTSTGRLFASAEQIDYARALIERSNAAQLEHLRGLIEQSGAARAEAQLQALAEIRQEIARIEAQVAPLREAVERARAISSRAPFRWLKRLLGA